ncbi:chemotaxis protein [Shewanella benthica]|uniref:chemotaxis protein n=1 Tax=Shewanella benthica TaxID=43661 RepID=UPI0018790F8E|nr:chemotaxis protein [Shewanella benthica]MBE7214305.1 chemotaxis protein [Shewanella benthica]MCL1064086.1 chemotaxis protein [Shewanella benthica]
MKALLRLSVFVVLALLTTACSLLEVKLESGVVPLPQEQLNMRVFSRDFSSTFYSRVEQTADQISALESNDEQDIYLKSNALMWKINAEQALQRTIFQASPVAAMVDTWAFTAQMSEFYDTGAGKTLFGEQQAQVIETSRALEAQFEKTVKGFVSQSDFNNNRDFIKQYVLENPLTDITFSRKSAFNDWLIFREINEFEAVTTFGSVPEVMSDISDRMAMISEQMPKILGWKAELYALHSNINAEEIQATLVSISETSARFRELMAQSPEMMQSLAVDMRRELSPLLQQLSDSTDDKLKQLSVERQALELMVKNERLALEEMVTRERVAGAANLDEISKHTVEVVFQELTKTLKSLILYFVLFLLVVFFAPLGLGVWLGKRMGNKKANKLSKETIS